MDAMQALAPETTARALNSPRDTESERAGAA
jgi:hypothetical protein